MTEKELKKIEVFQNELICKGGPNKGRPRKNADPAKLTHLKKLLDKQKTENPKTETRPNIKYSSLDHQDDIVQAERELRRYVKRAGGFRKGLPREDEVKVKHLMKFLNRKKAQWDNSIIVSGM